MWPVSVPSRPELLRSIPCARCSSPPPDALRSQLQGLSSAQLVAACARLRPGLARLGDPVQAAKAALRSLAIRAQHLDVETRALRKQLDQLTQEIAPATAVVFGLGPDTVSALLVTIGDNPDRLRSEAAFAHMCGVAPIPASSGKTNRHRLHRGGDRAGNGALHIAVRIHLERLPRDAGGGPSGVAAVGWNTIHRGAAFGGTKMSDVGRDYGMYALHTFSEPRAVNRDRHLAGRRRLHHGTSASDASPFPCRPSDTVSPCLAEGRHAEMLWHSSESARSSLTSASGATNVAGTLLLGAGVAIAALLRTTHRRPSQ